MILIYPPVVKPCEPPAGLAKLAGVMYAHDIRCKVIDANLEGIAPGSGRLAGTRA